MSLRNPQASSAFQRIRMAFAAACVGVLSGLMTMEHAHARPFDPHGDGFVRMMQVRGPGLAEERANERAMRQAARAQRQQQMQGQRGAQRNEQMIQRGPEREVAVAPPAERQAEGGRPGRLSPDERRALRQQINQAGRDVYRPGTPPESRP